MYHVRLLSEYTSPQLDQRKWMSSQ